MSIDYMWDEMDYARSAGLWTKGSTADPHSPEEAFNAGWRAALEAAHAKASAGGEGGRCVNCNGTGATERDGIDRGCPTCKQAGAERASDVPHFWAQTANVYSTKRYWAWRGTHGQWVYEGGITSGSAIMLDDWGHDGGELYTPCTTEAEARRVAGFENKEKP